MLDSEFRDTRREILERNPTKNPPNGLIGGQIAMYKSAAISFVPNLVTP
jgi:hypothetical protein